MKKYIKNSNYTGYISKNESNFRTKEFINKYDKNAKWITGEISTPAGLVPKVSTTILMEDRLGTLKVRLGIGRSNYKITPGLYGIGNPNQSSPVLVSSNYKLTFDALRSELNGLDCYVLILDTKGVNVWCAAGKGTFGTKELMRQISKTKLSKVISHKTLILPQLSAPGINPYEIKKHTDFKVVYGPVRSKDIKVFIESNCIASEDMRTVKFSIVDRLILTPVELNSAIKFSLIVFGILFIINLFANRPFGIDDFIAYIGAVVIGTVVTPILLPYIPGRAFAFKGFLLGLCWAIFISFVNGWFTFENLLLFIGYILILPSLSAYLSMNFTGSSTYTSFSGVMKEMKIALPLIIISMSLGVILVLIKSILG